MSLLLEVVRWVCRSVNHVWQTLDRIQIPALLQDTKIKVSSAFKLSNLLFHMTNLKLVNKRLLGTMMNELFDVRPVGCQCVIIVKSVDVDLPQVDVIVGKHAQRVDVRRKFLGWKTSTRRQWSRFYSHAMSSHLLFRTSFFWSYWSMRNWRLENLANWNCFRLTRTRLETLVTGWHSCMNILNITQCTLK